METINVLERNHERALSYENEKIDGKLRQNDKIRAKTERGGPYLLRDGITATIDKMGLADDTSVRSSSKTSFSFKFVELFKRAPYKYF